MNAVALVQRRLAGDPFEQEWDERQPVLPREIAVGLPERGDIFLAVVGRRLHPGEHHEHVLSLRSLDDLRQIALHLCDRKTAKTVVCTERHDEDANVLLQYPIEAPEPPR